MEMSGFEPEASYMRSKRSTTELHPQYTFSALPLSYTPTTDMPAAHKDTGSCRRFKARINLEKTRMMA